MNARLQALIKDKTNQDLKGLVEEIVPLIKQGLIPQSLLIFNSFDRPLLQGVELDAFEMLKKYSPWGIKLHFKAEKFLAVSRQSAFTLESGDYEKQIMGGNVFLHTHTHGEVSIFLLELTSGHLERVYHSTFNEPLTFTPSDYRGDKGFLHSLWEKSLSVRKCPIFRAEFQKSITNIKVAQKKRSN